MPRNLYRCWGDGKDKISTVLPLGLDGTILGVGGLYGIMKKKIL